VERRKEPRIAINENVTVTVLGETDSEPFQATALELSSNGMRLRSTCAVPYQAVVKVHSRDLLLLGEVIRVQAAEGGVVWALKLQHSLDSLGDLRRLNQSLRWEDHTVEVALRD
jgi:hypothetical protein